MRHKKAIASRAVVFAAVTMVAFAARAQNLAPLIDHQPIFQVNRGAPVTIQAQIRSQSGKAIFEPTVYVRLAGISGFARVAMAPVGGALNLYAAILAPSLVSSEFDYYIEAYDNDGNGPGRAASPDRPFHVTAAAPPPPPPVVMTQPDATDMPPPMPSYPPPPVVESQPPEVEISEHLPFVAVSTGIGSTFGGVLGVTAEGGIKWITGFVSVGYWPSVAVGSSSTPSLFGYQLGARAMFGSRRFKGSASVSLGTVGTSNFQGALNGVTFMVGGRVFFAGERRRMFIHFGLGVAVPFAFTYTNSANYVAFDLIGLGVEFFGR
jgi:hypothetical protein